MPATERRRHDGQAGVCDECSGRGLDGRHRVWRPARGDHPRTALRQRGHHRGGIACGAGAACTFSRTPGEDRGRQRRFRLPLLQCLRCASPRQRANRRVQLSVAHSPVVRHLWRLPDGCRARGRGPGRVFDGSLCQAVRDLRPEGCDAWRPGIIYSVVSGSSIPRARTLPRTSWPRDRWHPDRNFVGGSTAAT